MSKELESLLSEARKVRATVAQNEAQRQSFAFGNTHFENERITKETIQKAAKELSSSDAKDSAR